MGRDPLDAVHDATETLRLLREETDRADRSWRAAIRAALAAGVPVGDLADTAGVTRARIYQIRDDRR
jgi:hypothetical protein